VAVHADDAETAALTPAAPLLTMMEGFAMGILVVFEKRKQRA
jgi:hypothetical protein